MADFNALTALINAYIKQNGVKAITGQILNGVLRGMVSALGKGYTVAGEASPTTDPGTMTGPVAYIAHTAGTYEHFGNLVVAQGEVAMLIYDEAVWRKDVLLSLSANATVDANVGTPEVTCSFVDGVLTFDFRNMKGNPGVDGDPAGFGAVTATVDANVGTPGVSVQTSGPDTAKNIAFQFTNLKGETGVTSCVVTVDNTTGTPSCAVSLVGQELHLDFSGLKGAQGDTGSSVDYPFTIVNNLTTDDATQALSAAMGVQLESEVSQLEAEVNEKADQADLSQLQQQVGDAWKIEMPGRIANGVWWNDFAQYKHIIIPICSGDNVVLVPNSNTYYSVLKDYPTPVAGETPEFATGCSDRVLLSSTKSFIAPSDAKWLYVQSRDGGTSKMPFSIAVNGIEKLVENSTSNAIGITSQKAAKAETKEDAQLLELKGMPGAIMGNTYWEDLDTRFHFVIRVNGVEKITYTSANGFLYFAFLKTYTTPVSGETPDYCAGYSGRSVSNDGTITLPSDCRYLVINNPLVPSGLLTSLVIDGTEYIDGVVSALFRLSKRTATIESSLISTVKKSDVNVKIASNNLANPSLIQDGKFVNSTGRIASDANWSLIKLPVKPNTKYSIGGFYLGRSGYCAYYDATDTLLSFISYVDPNGRTTPFTIETPNNTAFIYVDIKSNSSPEDAYSGLQINEGNSFLAYDAFEKGADKILGVVFLAEDKGLRKEYKAQVLRNPDRQKSLDNAGYVKYADGTLNAGGYKTSDFIKVNEGDTISVKDIYASASVAILAAYSTNQESGYIQEKSRAGVQGYSSFDYVVPQGVSYIRLCCNYSPGLFENCSYGIIPYVPYVQDGRIAQNAEDSDEKLATMGIVRGMNNSKVAIRLYPQTKLPCVSFQFDDIPTKDSELVTLFESYGLTCAFAFIASVSNITNKAATYLRYQRRGFQIMNHSVDGTVFDTTNYTYQTALAAIMTALNRIQKAGMVCNGFVSPSSSMANEFLPILKAAHAYAFTSATASATANGRNQDTCQLHRYSLQSHTIAEIEQYIDDCITNDQIMTFYGHAADLVDDGDTTVFSIAKISAVIEYCIAKRDAGLLYVGGTDDCVKYFFDL